MAGSVVITRRFAAPRSAVWDAWTKPSLFARWWGVPPFETPLESVAMDVTTGGEWAALMVSDHDGTEAPFFGVYREVVEPSRLVFTLANPEDRSDPDVEVASVTLSEIDGETEMVFEQAGHLPPEQYEQLKAGYNGFFDRLAVLVEG